MNTDVETLLRDLASTPATVVAGCTPETLKAALETLKTSLQLSTASPRGNSLLSCTCSLSDVEPTGGDGVDRSSEAKAAKKSVRSRAVEFMNKFEDRLSKVCSEKFQRSQTCRNPDACLRAFWRRTPRDAIAGGLQNNLRLFDLREAKGATLPVRLRMLLSTVSLRDEFIAREAKERLEEGVWEKPTGRRGNGESFVKQFPESDWVLVRRCLKRGNRHRIVRQETKLDAFSMLMAPATSEFDKLAVPVLLQLCRDLRRHQFFCERRDLLEQREAWLRKCKEEYHGEFEPRRFVASVPNS